jgi:hypothetical protein
MASATARLAKLEAAAVEVLSRRTDRLEQFRADPANLMRVAGLEPDPWQSELLRSPDDADTLLTCGRQTGKSSCCAFLATKEALLSAGTTTLIVSPSLRQSGEMLRKVVGAVNALGRPVGVVNESASALVLANGSRVLSLPASESTIRGYSSNLLIVDEAARVGDDLLAGIRPMLAATGGRFVALSSAFARSGWYFDLWTEGGPSWLRLSVKSSECPRISKEFLAEERRILGERWYAMEYENVFGESLAAVFSLDDITRAFTSEVKPLFARPTPQPEVPLPAGDPSVRPLFGA